MLSLIPLPYRIAILAAVVAALCASSYVLGRKHVRAQFDAYKQAQAVEAALVKGEQEQRERMWTQAMTEAGRLYDERHKQADASFDASLDRLRSAYASTRGVRLAPGSAALCPETGRATAADLLRAGEALAGIARDADQDRAALVSCVGAWPR